ncbi:MAG: endolytic transglycosylase MltG [Herbaspirillum sp.]
MKKLLAYAVVLLLLLLGVGTYWSQQPILPFDHAPIDFTIQSGSSLVSSAQQIADAGVPVHPDWLVWLARVTGRSTKIKAGSYQIKPGVSPNRLLRKLERGEFAQESLTIIEGWTFQQMRAAIAAQPNLKHDSADWSDAELMAKITADYSVPEGLFAPDTYLYAKDTSDLQVYRQAYALQQKRLDEAWLGHDDDLPYKNPYQALIMASIVEKETGHQEERDMIAGVFINRLKLGMLLQTDPSVIYGMGAAYTGTIRRRDLVTDTPYNTYTRKGLPPTPISLPGVASLAAALHPAKTNALYFVARGDGSSHFSNNLGEHNSAVNKYQR